MGKNYVAVILVGGIGIAAVLWTFVRLGEITRGESLSIFVLAILAIITARYVRDTARIATATSRQAEAQMQTVRELQKERELRYSPLVYITNIALAPPNVPTSVFLRNLGYGVALEVHCTLKEGDEPLLVGHWPGLIAGEEHQVQMSSPGLPLGVIGSGAELVVEYYGADVQGPSYFTRFSFDINGNIRPLEFWKVHPAV